MVDTRPMAAPKNFATGFNHNVQHKGQMYHVQTEDSGPENATLSTHLFVGGTILATLRSSYTELVNAADMREQVRAQMESQHKQMLRNLVNGQYDGLGQAVPSYQPGEIATGTLLANGVAEVHGAAGLLSGAAGAVPSETSRRAPAASTGAGSAPPGPQKAATAPSATRPTTPGPQTAAMAPGPGHPTTPGPQRAALAPAKKPPSTAVAERLVGQRPAVPYADGWNHGGSPAGAPRNQPRAPLLASLEPQEKQGFFGDLISEKSLDQVILAYLAGEDDDER